MASQRPLTDDEGEVFDLAGDHDKPEWTDDMFARAVPFSGLPSELQALLSEEKIVKPDPQAPSKRQPAAWVTRSAFMGRLVHARCRAMF